MTSIPTTPTQSRTPHSKSCRKTQTNVVEPTTASKAEVGGGNFRSRFEAFNRLQAAAVAFGERLPMPEIVAVGGQSDGKSSLLEALLGFRFNIREVEMGTRRPLVLQMVHDPSALDPRCRFQEEDSDEYGAPIVSACTIADLIKSRTDAHLKKVQAAVSAKPIVMRVEYAHCPNLTIIDTPGFVLKAKKGEPESTPTEILSMVKALASPPHRLLLFLQQSSVEWCSSLWLDTIHEIDPSFRRTIIVISKFDNRLKEFTDRWEVDKYLSASGYLGESTRPFFVALPKERTAMSNEEFRKQISQVDTDVLHHLRENVKGGFNEEKYEAFVGFGCLRDYLESELQRRYKEAAPATLALLEKRCGELAADLARLDSKLQATSDVACLRKLAMLHTASICYHVGALIDGAADPPPEIWGKTSDEELLQSGAGTWPGITAEVRPPNYALKLYGGAAFERVMHEFRCAIYSIECPQVSREKVANILLAHAGRGGGGVAAAAAEIARAAARAWLAPLLHTACERLAYVLRNLFDLALERNRSCDSDYLEKNNDMDGYISFHAALRRSYFNFIQDLSMQCKQLVRNHLDSVTSPHSQICYSYDVLGPGSGSNSLYRHIQAPGPFFFDLSDNSDQGNRPPKDQQHITPGKTTERRDALRESQLTIPETPSPDQPGDVLLGGGKLDNSNCIDIAAKKRQARLANSGRNSDIHNNVNLSLGIAGLSSKSGSSYTDICSIAAQHFARIREVLIERDVPSVLNSGFLVSCRNRMLVALGVDLFAVNDQSFMDMFVAPGVIDVIQGSGRSYTSVRKY